MIGDFVGYWHQQGKSTSPMKLIHRMVELYCQPFSRVAKAQFLFPRMLWPALFRTWAHELFKQNVFWWWRSKCVWFANIFILFPERTGQDFAGIDMCLTSIKVKNEFFSESLMERFSARSCWLQTCDKVQMTSLRLSVNFLHVSNLATLSFITSGSGIKWGATMTIYDDPDRRAWLSRHKESRELVFDSFALKRFGRLFSL